jgi:hypothetical protein
VDDLHLAGGRGVQTRDSTAMAARQQQSSRPTITFIRRLIIEPLRRPDFIGGRAAPSSNAFPQARIDRQIGEIDEEIHDDDEAAKNSTTSCMTTMSRCESA